jgi:DNA-directed RNA polymerase specialized sigma24 family protein
MTGKILTLGEIACSEKLLAAINRSRPGEGEWRDAWGEAYALSRTILIERFENLLKYQRPRILLDAEDIAHMAWLDLLRIRERNPEFQFDLRGFYPTLVRIANRRMADAYRRAIQREEYLVEDLPRPQWIGSASEDDARIPVAQNATPLTILLNRGYMGETLSHLPENQRAALAGLLEGEEVPTLFADPALNWAILNVGRLGRPSAVPIFVFSESAFANLLAGFPVKDAFFFYNNIVNDVRQSDLETIWEKAASSGGPTIREQAINVMSRTTKRFRSACQ